MRDKKEGSFFLEICNLSTEYMSDRKIVHAVNGVNLKLNKGETLGLVGETGAGKTTIAKAILRILPDKQSKVTGGSIWLDGENLSTLKEKEMRKVRGKKISMIFQDPMTALNPTKTVGVQVAEAIYLHEGCTKKDAAVQAKRMMEMVGIPAIRYAEYPHQFSGGMKQRIVIAIALACQPELLLADEPTTALDVTIQAQVLDMIAKLKEELHTSMIMITHDLGIVAGTCDYVAVIYAGEVIEYGTTAEIFDAPSHPYTVGLFGSLPSLSGDEKRLHPIDE
ncbi:MAG: ABC transporter ATP-binding protein [Lachnospiraceae bacterium]